MLSIIIQISLNSIFLVKNGNMECMYGLSVTCHNGQICTRHIQIHNRRLSNTMDYSRDLNITILSSVIKKYKKRHRLQRIYSEHSLPPEGQVVEFSATVYLQEK